MRDAKINAALGAHSQIQRLVIAREVLMPPLTKKPAVATPMAAAT